MIRFVSFLSCRLLAIGNALIASVVPICTIASPAVFNPTNANAVEIKTDSNGVTFYRPEPDRAKAGTDRDDPSFQLSIDKETKSAEARIIRGQGDVDIIVESSNLDGRRSKPRYDEITIVRTTRGKSRGFEEIAGDGKSGEKLIDCSSSVSCSINLGGGPKIITLDPFAREVSAQDWLKQDWLKQDWLKDGARPAVKSENPGVIMADPDID